MRLAACLLWAAAGAWAQDEVPFITTPDQVTLAMLELAQVGPNDHVIDLGSGDGRIVITAARRFGASGLGVEIVPDLVRKSRDSARAAGVAERVEFREQDLFATDLSRATVVTLYLLPEVNLQLRPRLLALPAGTRIVSHDWDMGDWAPERSVTLDVPDKAIGRDKRSTVHLWRVPPRVQGLWCSSGATLAVTQHFQQFSAVLHTGPRSSAPALVFDGRIAGTRLQAQPPHDAELQADPHALRVLRIGALGAPVAGRTFTRAGAAGC
jgi:hypothetical protein